MQDIAKLTMTLEEVAAALGLRPAALKRRHRELHARFGLPLPLAASGGIWRWPAVATRNWLETGFSSLVPVSADPASPPPEAGRIAGSPPASVTTSQTPDNAGLVRRWQHELADIYGARR